MIGCRGVLASHQQAADVFHRAGLIPRAVDAVAMWDRTSALANA